ncbi:hypothetical protein B0T16DRAFT_422464 [Cercophora newfieldiana]|uniref:Uncharacterized protein n=1 Tax=Cercophora newfieldiana TaxID=92897 RepID=A0AA39XRY3_9PEZI|nr:hypothetical protein B0T16DRAFT_422464 [Cercophora newfieldiana]
MSENSRCSANPAWAATPAAYNAAQTDAQLERWWAAQPRDVSFARQLGQSFGDQRTFFECGINREPSCTISGCDIFARSDSPIWSYQALMSVMNLNMYFNAIFDGVVAGQLGYTNSIPQIAKTFFPPQDETFPFGDAAPWIIAILTVLFAIPLLAGETAALVGVGAGALLIGSTTTVNDQLEPLPATNILSVVEMQNYAGQYGETTRHMLSDWANTTFQGQRDGSDRTILNYISGGAFVNADVIPTPKAIEGFYKAQMASRTINAKWRTSRVFIMFTQTLDEDNISGPNQTKYYSKEDKGVYYLYEMHEGNRMTSQLGKPEGLDEMNGTQFGITGQDITKSSARAFRAGGFNYTQEIQTKELEDAMASNHSLDPFAEGAGWSGTWTIPVCDTGKFDWNIQYDDSSLRYGRLPCCCGENCKDTKEFVKAANLLGSQTYLRGCYEQLKPLAGINFEKIDYGFKWETTFPVAWLGWSDGVRAGVVIGMIVGGAVVLGLLLCCCCCILGL